MCIDPGTENQFPFAIGIRVNGFPCQEFTASGDAFNFIIPAKSKMRTPVSIFESRGDENLHLTWQAEYAKWNMENLDTCGVLLRRILSDPARSGSEKGMVQNQFQ